MRFRIGQIPEDPLASGPARMLPMRFPVTFVAPVLLLLSVTSGNSEDYRKTLISTEENIRVEEWNLDFADLGLPVEARWSIRKDVLRGGKQEGVNRIVMDNGLVRFVIIPTRGMSILEVTMGNLRLGWDSPVRESVHPRHIDLQSRGGLGWLEGFNEWMVRCGLESAGHPGEDRFTNNTGDEAVMNLTLHGKIGNIPASEVEVVVEGEAPYRIGIRGRVDERMFYGPQLELWTELWTQPGSPAFTLRDALTNRGGSDQEFQLIYHANFGPPILEEGARLVAPMRQVSPFNDHAAMHMDWQPIYGPPAQGFTEQVYCLRLVGGTDDRTEVVLHNAMADKGVLMAWSLAELPYLTQWKNTADSASGYVTGIEPGTGFPYNRNVERLYDRVPVLKPGETRRFHLDFTLLAEPRDVADAVDRIRTLARGVRTRIQTTPEADPELTE